MDYDAPSPIPTEPTSRSDSGLLAGAIVVLVLGAILAIYLVLQDESTDVDTTSPTTTTIAPATDDAADDTAPDSALWSSATTARSPASPSMVWTGWRRQPHEWIRVPISP
ncbi:MAG: hypothetical protein EX269_13665 [Acidimicrobiales bacterium]|nr:MAG: hypothetical protein EX269_13665 [Acidimicrobiales bacterium]